MKKLNGSEFEYYGEEMVDAVNVINAQSEVLRDLEGRVERASEFVNQTAEDRFWKRLAELVPDYKEINATEEWKDWLKGIDPLAGVERQTLLMRARAANDADRVATFFEKYKSTVPGPGSRRPSRDPRTVTRAEYQKAVNDRVKGLITEQEFDRIADSYQRSLTS